MRDFCNNDVLKVAELIVGNSVERKYQGDYGMHEYMYECWCCGADSPEKETLTHETTCEFLIARDLLVK